MLNRVCPRLSALTRLAKPEQALLVEQVESQRGQLGADVDAGLYEPWLNVDTMQSIFLGLHENLQVPWWVVLGSVNLGFRFGSWPLQVEALQAMRERRVKLDEFEPARLAITESMLRRDRELAKTQILEYNEALKSRKLASMPRVNKIVIALNIGWFLTYMGAIRGFLCHPDLFPSFILNSEFLHLTSLALPDPTGVLPVLSSAAYLAALECREEFRLHPQAEKMRLAMRGLTFLFLPLASQLPAAFYLFMATNAMFNASFALWAAKRLPMTKPAKA